MAAWRVAAVTSQIKHVRMTSTDARQILARMVASVWIESTATNVNVAAVYMTKCFTLVFTVKLTTVGVTPTLVRTVERASQTVAERVARVNPRGLKVIFIIATLLLCVHLIPA